MRVIVNPFAGKGSARRCLAELYEVLDRDFPDHELIQTEGPKHAEMLARESAFRGEALLVAVGGDGTISEVVNGLAGSGTALGILAVGTGNDVARTLGLPVNRPLEALQLVRRGVRRRIDLGWDGTRYFVSILGIGFPAIVAAEANRQRHFGGALAFSFSVYRRISEMRTARAAIVADGVNMDLECTSILVQNTPFTGGGLRVAPEAEVDDELLDVVIVDDIGKINLLWNFPRIYKGTHVTNPHFHIFRCRKLEIETDPSLPVTIDGDPHGVSPVHVEVAPAAVAVVVEGRRGEA
jgi:diacylglycerol kinase (ATP)